MNAVHPCSSSAKTSLAQLQRFQERDDLVPLRLRQVVNISVADGQRLTAVSPDCVVEGFRVAVVHQAGSRAHAPQRRRTKQGSSNLPAVLHDSVAGPYIM